MREAKNSFTLICNNCGAKSIIRQHEKRLRDEEGKYIERDIIQEGDVKIQVNYKYEEEEIVCSKCGLNINSIM